MGHMTNEERADASLVLPGNPQALKRIERIAKSAGARASSRARATEPRPIPACRWLSGGASLLCAWLCRDAPRGLFRPPQPQPLSLPALLALSLSLSVYLSLSSLSHAARALPPSRRVPPPDVRVDEIGQFLGEFQVMRKTSQAMAQGKSPDEVRQAMMAAQDEQVRTSARARTHARKAAYLFGWLFGWLAGCLAACLPVYLSICPFVHILRAS
jgi:hypothetical protein